ncbi:MAG: ATP-binding cassette domain-containing protein, partial [Ruminococcus sp.]|nr:ATP-binding cassette domain-containing protein [Ruminococcus sp.]
FKENIAVSETSDEQRVIELSKKVGLGKKIEDMPQGIDTMMFKLFDQSGVEPSGGEQQKMSIARALYKDSPIVILDEPTAALDPIAEYEIYKQFNDIVSGKTAIYISHRLSSCKFCDKIAVFKDGVVKEYGNHTELLKISDGEYQKMYAVQAKYYVNTDAV